MSISDWLFSSNTTNTETQSPNNTLEISNKHSIQDCFSFLMEKTIVAYDMTRDTSFSFPEEIIISPTETDKTEITIITPTNTIEFSVRTEGYTSRFGELDVSYITVTGYAINLYHPKPESEKFFVRRLFYYEDENGIGNEIHWDEKSKPKQPDWEIGSGEVTVSETESYLRVYDWRQQMLTHDKPTPKEGEVVFQYQDSLNKGGNRDATNIVLTVTNLQFTTSETVDIQYISFEEDTGHLVLYGETENLCVVGQMRIDDSLTIGAVSWVTVEQSPRPSQIDNLVWVRNPEDTWAVAGVKNSKAYI